MSSNALQSYYDAVACFLNYPENSGYDQTELDQMLAALSPEDRQTVDEPKHSQVVFIEPDSVHNNFGLQLRTNDPLTYRLFKHWARVQFDTKLLGDPRDEECRSFGAFFQSDLQDTFFYIEFWRPKTPEFRAKIMAKLLEAKTKLATKGVNFT